MKNLLIEYQGGGYSGCFWEWNFAFIDGQGQFHDIYSSGSGGCDSMKKLLFVMLDDHTTTYDLSTEEGLQQIRENVHIDFQKQIANWIYDNTEFELLLECGSCKSHCDSDEMTLEGATGDGGIGVTHDLILCNDCHSEGRCGECGEYTGADNLLYSEHREGDLCEWCHEENSRHCIDCGEVEVGGINEVILNSQRICPDCQASPAAPKKGQKWHDREYQGKQVFILC